LSFIMIPEPAASKGLFDEDDDDGGLFGAKSGAKKPSDKGPKQAGGLFGDDPLFG
jgi:hypothetical protein